MQTRSRTTPYVFSTVKGYSGHQGAGATAGIIEAVLAVSHAAVAPALHLRTLNPHIVNTLEQSGTAAGVGLARGGPYGVPATRATVSSDTTSVDTGLRMGVSSFGANGTNAHVIVAGCTVGNPVTVGGIGKGVGLVNSATGCCLHTR